MNKKCLQMKVLKFNLHIKLPKHLELEAVLAIGAPADITKPTSRKKLKSLILK